MKEIENRKKKRGFNLFASVVYQSGSGSRREAIGVTRIGVKVFSQRPGRRPRESYLRTVEGGEKKLRI